MTLQNKSTLVTRATLAEALGVSTKTIERMEKAGLPRIVPVPGGHSRYDIDLVLEWVRTTRAKGETK
jgi:predicted DNA-binding transcriptional regulator YafY